MATLAGPATSKEHAPRADGDQQEGVEGEVTTVLHPTPFNPRGKRKTMTKSSDLEMKERKALAGSTTSVTTYRDRAIADLGLEAQGRFAKGVEVTGSKPAVLYPRQPPASPWSGDIPEGVEPPLGYSVEDLEPTGERFEIEESLAASSTGTSGAAEVSTDALSSVDDAPAPSALHPLAAEGVSLIRGRRL
jgi:hypothetical protein